MPNDKVSRVRAKLIDGDDRVAMMRAIEVHTVRASRHLGAGNVACELAGVNQVILS